MATELQEQSKSDIARLAGRFLTFILARQCCGIEVIKTREIIRMSDITTVPRMPAYVRGVISLRGKIIPVIYLRLRFDFDQAKRAEQICIVVLANLSGGKTTQMGTVVDAVEKAAPIAASDIKVAPDFGVRFSTKCLLGMAKVKGTVKTLSNIDRVVCGLLPGT
jgi:purine-binding chemotaxis protein CheW